MIFSVVIPMYNEKAIAKDSAVSLVDKLESAAIASSFEYEIIFSDDGSTDGCGEIITEFEKEYAHPHGDIRLERSEVNRGKGNAVRRGILASRGDVVLFTDSDLAYGVDVIVDMFDRFTKEECDADIMIGSRAIDPEGYKGYTFMRRLASKIYLKTLTLYAGFNHSDSQCGIKMFRGESARRLFSYCECDKWAFDFEALLIAEKLGMRVAEHPVHIINHRESKIHLVSDSIKMLGDIKKIKKRVKGLRLS
jgi:glycosyltransferase involved in cell wall biosynthesis